MKQAYIDHNFRAKSLSLIEHANELGEEYAAMGYSMTLRQMYYQLVSRWPLVYENTDKNYKRIGAILTKARLAGYLDWDYLEDRLRPQRRRPEWTAPQNIINSAYQSYNVDMWKNQKVFPVVLFEKDALLSVIQSACEPLGVTYQSTRGYNSITAMRDWADLFNAQEYEGRQVHVFHLTDHDPSGLDMFEDMQNRMDTFGVYSPTYTRLALTMEQIQERNLPPNPAKLSDSRAKAYVKQHGYESWEMDGLSIPDLVAMITEAIEGIRDDAQWEDDDKPFQRDKKTLRAFSTHYSKIQRFLTDEGDIESEEESQDEE